MSTSLLGAHISLNATRAAFAAASVEDMISVIKDDDAAASSAWIPPEESQRLVMFELVGHMFRAAKEFGFRTEVANAFVNVVVQTHLESMERTLTMKHAYNVFQSYVVAHSVHRPPYSTAVFTLADVTKINDYILKTYFRHYRMYLHVFTARRECTLTCRINENLCEVPKVCPSLTTAMPLKEWEVKQAEIRRVREAEEAKRMEEEAAAEAAAEVERKRIQKAHQAENAPGSLTAQLAMIRETVGHVSAERFDDLEGRLLVLEGKLGEAMKSREGKKGGKK